MLRLCMCRATEIMVGWGGDGRITLLAHVHIFDATPVFLSCSCTEMTVAEEQ